MKQKIKILLLLLSLAIIQSCSNSPQNKGDIVTTESSSGEKMAFSTTLPQSSTGYYELLIGGDTIYHTFRDSTVTKSVSFTFHVEDTTRHRVGSVLPHPPPPLPDTITNTGGTSGYNTLVYQNAFDKNSDINSNQLGQGSISTSIFKSGTGSFKSVVSAGESQISGGWRSEQQYPESYTPNGQETSTDYDELFESLPASGLSVQWHGNVSGTSGETSLWISSGKFMVQRNTCGTAGCPNTNQSGSLASIQLNRWYHMRWEIKFSSGSDGYERLYIDGVLYFSMTGKTADGGGQYLKVGQNLFPSTPKVTSIMYIDNLIVRKK